MLNVPKMLKFLRGTSKFPCAVCWSGTEGRERKKERKKDAGGHTPEQDHDARAEGLEVDVSVVLRPRDEPEVPKDLHPDDGVDEEEHGDQQDDVRERLEGLDEGPEEDPDGLALPEQLDEAGGPEEAEEADVDDGLDELAEEGVHDAPDHRHEVEDVPRVLEIALHRGGERKKKRGANFGVFFSFFLFFFLFFIPLVRRISV